jgi:hypothetical protein
LTSDSTRGRSMGDMAKNNDMIFRAGVEHITPALWSRCGTTACSAYKTFFVSEPLRGFELYIHHGMRFHCVMISGIFDNLTATCIQHISALGFWVPPRL